jgi:hypothetical protein
MYEVKKVKDKATLIDTYKAAFKDRFGKVPLINMTTAIEVMTDLLTDYGFEDSEKFVASYVVLGDPWLEKQGYPLELLKRSLNRIIVQTAPSITASSSPIAKGRGPEIQLMFSCDFCGVKFLLKSRSEDLAKRQACPACVKAVSS